MPRIDNTGCSGGNIDKVVLIKLDNLQLEYHMTSTNQGTLELKVTQPFKVRITLCEVGLTRLRTSCEWFLYPGSLLKAT